MTDLGTLTTVDGRPTIRFDRRFRAGIDRVWRAVSDEDEMRQWFPAGVVGERSEGSPLKFPFEGEETSTFEGEVVTWDPPKEFAFTWHGDLLRFTLSSTADGTTLVFTHQLQDRTEAPRTATGWHTCLDALLEALGEPTDGADSRFGDYLRRMGPPLARRDGDDLVFERVHFLPPDEFRDAVAAWGEADGAEVTIEEIQFGTRYDVRVRAVDPVDAARWHAALVELDMFASSGRRPDVDDSMFVDDYRRLLT